MSGEIIITSCLTVHEKCSQYYTSLFGHQLVKCRCKCHKKAAESSSATTTEHSGY